MNIPKRFFVFVFIFVFCCVSFLSFISCKKKKASDPELSLTDAPFVHSLKDSTVEFFNPQNFITLYFVDMDLDRNPDVTLMVSHDTDGDDSWTLFHVSGSQDLNVKTVFPRTSTAGTQVCTHSGTTTTVIATSDLMQRWHHSGDRVSTADTSGNSTIAIVSSESNSGNANTSICHSTVSSLPGGDGEAYIVVRKIADGKIQIGWIKVKVQSQGTITFRSFHSFVDTESLVLP